MKFEPCPFAEKQAYGVIDEEQLNSNHFKYWLAGPAGRLPLMEVMTENADGSGYATVTAVYGKALLHYWGELPHGIYPDRVDSRATLREDLIEFRKYLAEQHALGCLAAGGVL
jgi:hypothetical protein